MKYETYDRKFSLGDNGTLDTVINVECLLCGQGWCETLSQEFVAPYRNQRGQIVDLENMVDEARLNVECCPKCNK